MNIGRSIRPAVYLVRNASMINGRTKYKNFEFFLTPKTVKYIAHIEKETPGRSMPPVATHDITIGNDINIKLPVKLWILLKR